LSKKKLEDINARVERLGGAGVVVVKCEMTGQWDFDDSDECSDDDDEGGDGGPSESEEGG
jgi:hypothetical protein